MAFDGSAIKALLDGAVSKGALHGVAAVVVDRSGQLFHHAAGEAGERTMFRNASMTKAVATTAALQLVEQGRLDLDATVESILPEFGKLQLLEGFDGDSPRLRAPAGKATVRQLMTHTAGLGYPLSNEKLMRYMTLTGEPSHLSGKKRSLSVPMVNDPGSAWAYGLNTDWLGLVGREDHRTESGQLPAPARVRAAGHERFHLRAQRRTACAAAAHHAAPGRRHARAVGA